MTSATGQSLNTVSVTVRIAAPDYVDRFGPDVTSVEAEAARLFVAFLNPKVGFLSFAANADTLPHRLSFVLTLRDTTSGGRYSDVGFRTELVGPKGALESTYWLKVRGAEGLLEGVGTPTKFISRLKEDILPHADAVPLRDALRKIPIASDGLVNPEPFGWALLLRATDLCLRLSDDDEILFLIASEIRGGPMPIPLRSEARVIESPFAVAAMAPPERQKYVGGLFMMPTPTARDELPPATSTDSLFVKQVYVLTYQHDPSSCRSREPGPQ